MKTIIRASLTLGMIWTMANCSFAGVIVAWSDVQPPDTILSTVPSGNDFVAVAAGRTMNGYFGLALRSDGSIAAWGRDHEIVDRVPPGTGYSAIASYGCSHHPHGGSLALTSDGHIAPWGDSPFMPPLEVHEPLTAIAGGRDFVLGLNADGWIGASAMNPLTIPGGAAFDITPPAGSNFTAIAAGYFHGLALSNNGTIAAWGNDKYGQVSKAPTDSGFTSISAGWRNSLALQSDGSIVAWGDNSSETPEEAGFIDIAAGPYSLALREDGSIVSWGYGSTTSCPTDNGFTDIAVYGFLGLAIRSTVSFPEAGEGDMVYVDEPVTGPKDEQTVGSAIVGDGGTLTMPDSGTLNADDGVTVDQGGALDNGGTVNGDVTNNGTVDSDGGTFNGDINNTGDLTSNGGEHYGDLTNSGTVTSYDGYHEGNSTNTGTINSSGGVNNGDIVNYGDMFCSGGGVFNGTCINYGNLICTGYGSGGGTLINYGTITYFGGEEFQDMDNQGTFDLGQGAFTTEFDGDFSQSADGSMLAEIGGHIQGEEYDFIHVTGSASLEGSIDVSLIGDFSPNLDDAFTIMTADSGIAVGEAGLSIVGDGCFSWRIVDGKSLQLVSVPEPATFTLLAMAAILLVGFWRLRS